MAEFHKSEFYKIQKVCSFKSQKIQAFYKIQVEFYGFLRFWLNFMKVNFMKVNFMKFSYFT